MHRHASLNRIYRLIWSHVHRTWVAVSEVTRGKGKRTGRKLLAVTMMAAISHMAHAGPASGQVTAGSGNIAQSGNTTTVTQSSQNLSLNWQSFNTTAAETVNFVQPSASAVAVNRVLDTNPTKFLGHLNANGQVYLINPNGVLFGAGSQINVGGLVASTFDINDSGLNGAARNFSGNGTGSIINQGSINTSNGGYVAFIGNSVSNQGSIAAPAGTVALGAGSDVTLSFAGNSLLKMQVNQSTLNNLAENGGLIRADGGAVLMSAGAKDAVLASVVNNTGIIEARSVQNVNGTIVLDGGAKSTVTNNGTLYASGKNAGETGGTVKVLGENVNLASTSKIDVSGNDGGGTALIGGNFLGAGPEQNAQNTVVAAGSTINADAIANGNGGKVAVWSDDVNNFNGSISARGGQAGGDGGSVETSGKYLKIGSAASVSTVATHGRTGDWLLDPQDITIGGFSVAGDIDYQDLSNNLQSSNVTIKTGPSVSCTGITCPAGSGGHGDIILTDGISIGTGAWTSGTTLTLSAYRNIEFQGNASVDASSGNGNVVLRADNTGTGTGTVLMGNHGTVYGNATGKVDIYYNPTSYASPTLYENLIDPDFGNNLINAPNFNAYMLVNLTANIANKTYDGNTTATYTGLSVSGVSPGGITVDVSNATASFADKNAGSNKSVIISGVILSGANASKYFINGLDSKIATINKADLSLSGITADNKTYDGTTAATISGTASLSTAIGSDVVSVSGTGAGSTFATKGAGTGKTVTVAGYTLTGAAAGNYNLVVPINLTANVTKANLNVSGVSAANKTYDGTTGATLSGTATATAIGSDVVSVSGTGVGAFADKNAGSNKAVTVTGYSLTGTDAGNYNIVQPSGLTATINKANLNVSGILAADKTYEATSAAVLNGTAAVSAIGGDVVSVTGTGVGSFANKNAGTNKAVTVTGYSLTGTDAGNYNIVQPTGLSATINKANLALSGITANGKTYDATTTVTLAGTATVTALGSDVVSVSGSGAGTTFATKDAGTGKAVTVAGYTLGGTDAGNYNLVLPTSLTADVTKANLNVSGVTAANKTYDGSTTATINGTASVAGLGSDVVSVTGTGTGTFANKNAGANKAVTVTGYTLSGADAGNYNVVQPTGLTATINQAALNVAGLTGADKTYDGTNTATLNGTASVTAFGSDVVAVTGTGSGAFANKNAGANRALTVTGYSLTGADAGNYNIVQPTGLTASINKADLTFTGVTAANKTYDGTTSATLTGTAAVSALGSDVVSVTGTGTGTFANKNAGANKAVAVTGYSLTGTDAGNYNIVQPTGLTATINKADLNVSGVTASNKTYDGTTAATLTGTASVTALGSDVVSVSGTGTGSSFATKDVGTGKAVTISGYTLGGTDAANYNLVLPIDLTANVTKADLTISGVTAANKTYDGTNAGTLTGTASVSAFGSDVLSLGGTANATFADKNAATNKAVTVTGYSLTGTDAGNYNLLQPAGLTATINKADLALTGLSTPSKVYDGTTSANLSGTATITPIGSDVVTLSGTGVGNFLNKNVGTNKALTVSGYTLTGADAGNYNVVAPNSLTADITPVSIIVSGITANDKAFDGTTSATTNTSGAVLTGRLGSDVVTVNATGTFADAAVGNGKTVNLNSTYSGADAGNYVYTDQATTVANITAASVTPVTPVVPAAPEASTPSAVPAAVTLQDAPAQQVKNTVTQVQSSVLPPQAATQPQSLSLSSTILVSRSDADSSQEDKSREGGGNSGSRLVNTATGFGTPAPKLRIQNGGMQLPPMITSATK